MRLLRMLHFISATLAAVSALAASAIYGALELFTPFAAKLELFALPRLALDMAGGDQIDAATFHRSRHESATHRRSAARKI